MLYLIGLGLGDEKDITVRGLEVVKKCKFVFLEMYTAILGIGIERLVCYPTHDLDCLISLTNQF